jgi:hypothetical protein
MRKGNNGGRPEWSDMRPHEEFLELCALSTTGELTAEEQKKLREHLAVCAECREALKEFEAVTDVGVPLLASEMAREGETAEVPASRERVNVESGHAFVNPGAESPDLHSDLDSESQKKGFDFGHRNGGQGTEVNWNYVWMPFAAAILLTIAMGIYSYEVGQRHGLEVAQQRTPPAGGSLDAQAGGEAPARLEALEQRMSDVGHEREVLKAQLAERDRAIRELERQVESQSAALREAKTAQEKLEHSLDAEESEKREAAKEESSLREKLLASEASLGKAQTELDSARRERDEGQLRAGSLEGQIKGLYAQLKEREQTINRQDELLAHDRDIRDLMGARDLYIAEVYDVAGDGATQKPYGRVFYTKGKSLIFYAYDLDEQAGVKATSTFQAWGRRGPEKQQALNLGIFFEDNAAKKRWVLKFDDPKTLDQIDAVFVTVEPSGGSRRPSGKPLLFASLRIEPNHP